MRRLLLVLAFLAMASPSWGAKALYSASVLGEGLTASARYILVDLSDTSGYPHNDANGIRLYRITGNFERREGGWDIRFGLVLENDATNGTAQWFYLLHMENDDQATDDHAFRQVDIDFAVGDEGFQLMRIASNASQRTVSSTASGDQTWLQNDAGDMADAQGSTTKSAGAGDLVMEVEEVADTGTFDFSVTVLYSTE